MKTFELVVTLQDQEGSYTNNNDCPIHRALTRHTGITNLHVVPHAATIGEPEPSTPRKGILDPPSNTSFSWSEEDDQVVRLEVRREPITILVTDHRE